MTALFPTKTRLALLQAVGNHDVWKIIGGESIELLDGDDQHRVTTAIAEQKRAGWVTLSDVGRWELTDLGRAVLDAARDGGT